MIGRWSVQATVPGGGGYTGTVEVSPVGDTLELLWDTTAGRYSGIGLWEGDAWYVACGPDASGLGLALVGGAGRLRWSPAPARGTVGTAAPASAGPPRGGPLWSAGPGSPVGLPLLSVALTGAGDIREATLAGGRVERGLALRTATGWAIAWYPRFDQTVILRYSPGRRQGTWEAVWALGGHPDGATERLRPIG